MVHISAVKPWPGNPRINDGEPVQKVAESIRRFGWGSPIVARRATGEIIAGHTRWKAAKELGLEEIPVRFVDLSASEAHLLAVSDNRLNEIAKWDNASLYSLLKDAESPELDVVGFTRTQIDKMATGILGKDLEDPDAPALPTNAVTQVGDVWRLGDHVLVCGNSTDVAVWGALGQPPAAMITDPPYGIDYGGCMKTQMEEGVRARAPIENDALSPAELQKLLVAVFGHALTHCSAGAPYYVFGPAGAELSHVFLTSLDAAGWLLKHTLIWVKHAMVFGRADYHYKHEPCWYGWKPGAAHHFGGTTSDTSVLEFDRPTRSKEHPTMKPVKLIAHLLERAVGPGGYVVDPFMGSGTTMIAAEQLERRALGIELSPGYCDVIVERWQNLTGGKAVRG